MFFKRIISCVLILAMFCSMLAYAEGATDVLVSQNTAATEQVSTQLTQAEINKAATGFTDIAADAAYTAAVKKLVDFGIISGYPDGTFRPEGEVTRAEMCKMINLTLGYTDFEGAVGFTDVTSSNWYYAFALAAQKQGYVEGYEDGSFRGSNNITRQEVCAILNRLLKPMNLGIPVVINDAVSNWARPHVEIIVQNFIMPLEANNTFRATENLKRHELATVLANMAIGPVKNIEANVRFFVNGEQYGETQTIMVGNCAVVPEDPKVPGADYIFEGWRPIGTPDVIDVSSNMVVADVDYEAVFSKKLHDVTFYSRGAVYDTRVVEHGKMVEAPKNPSAKGYEFLGWSLKEDGELVKLSSMKIVENTNFYAVFEKEEAESTGGGGGGGGGGGAAETEKTYSVKFFVNGDLHDSQKVIKNGIIKKPTDPELEGYKFLGWSLEDEDDIVNPSSVKVTSNVTFNAVFEEEAEPEPEVFIVTFVVDGKTHDTQEVEIDNTPDTPANPSKEGYTFKGWSKSEGGAIVTIGYFRVTSDTKFYAVFEKKAEEKKYFTVSFYADNKLHDDVEVEQGGTVSTPAAPSKAGYTFKGWSKTNGGSVVNVSTVTITANTSFYAVFERTYYTVNFIVDGSTYESLQVADGDKATAPADPSKDDYNFLGWSKTKDGNIVDVKNVDITSGMNFYAVFEKKEEEKTYYTVNFSVDGSNYDSQKVVEGGKATVPSEPSKSGYNFKGWSKTDGGSIVNVEAAVINSNTTFYAVFEKKIVYHFVYFVVDGDTYETQRVVEGNKATLPEEPEMDGYTFIGWAKSENGDPVTVTSVAITTPTYFYAVFEEKEEEKIYHTVNFVVDENDYDSQKVVEGGKAVKPADPSKDGYTFKGWSKTKDGSVVDVTASAVTSNVTYYAVFKKDEVYYTVTFYVDGDSYDEQKVLEGECPEVPDNPRLDGYVFLGWAKSENGSTVYPDRIEVTSNLKYYAVFEEEEEEIKYYKVLFWVDGDVYKDYEVAEGDSIGAPAAPSLEEGATFAGWTLKEEGGKDDVIDVSDEKITDNTDFYAVILRNPNDPELMKKLNRGYEQLSKIRATGLSRDAIGVIKECVGYIIADANSGEYIDKSYVSDNYGDMVDEVRIIVNETMTSKERSSFIGTITNTRNIDKDVQDFLIDYFDIDTSVV